MIAIGHPVSSRFCQLSDYGLFRNFDTVLIIQATIKLCLHHPTSQCAHYGGQYVFVSKSFFSADHLTPGSLESLSQSLDVSFVSIKIGVVTVFVVNVYAALLPSNYTSYSNKNKIGTAPQNTKSELHRTKFAVSNLCVNVVFVVIFLKKRLFLIHQSR